MRHRKAVLIAVVILSVPILLVASGMLFLQSHWFSEYVSNRLSDQWGREVHWRHPLTIDWSLTPVFIVEDLQLADADWSNRDQMLTAERITVGMAPLLLLRGIMAIPHIRIDEAQLHLVSSADNGDNWDPFLPDDVPDVPAMEARIGEVILQRVLITYSASEEQTDIHVEADNSTEQSLEVKAEGEFRGESFAARVAGEPIAAGAEAGHISGTDAAYRLQGDARWRDHQLDIQGHTGSLTRLSALDLSGEAGGSNLGEILALLDMQGEMLPYELYAEIDYQSPDKFTGEHRGTIGQSTFHGSLAFDGGEKPGWQTTLQISEVDLDSVGKLLPDSDPESSVANGDDRDKNVLDRFALQLEKLQTFDADVQIDVGRLQKNGVVVQNLQSTSRLLDAKLDQRIGMTMGGGEILWTAELDATRKNEPAGRAQLALDMIDLGVALAPVGLSVLGTLDGELGLVLRDNRLTVDGTEVHYHQPEQKSEITLRLTNRDSEATPDGVGVEVFGQIGGKDLRLDLTTGPLLDLAKPDVPHAVDGQFDFSDNAVSISGTLQQPLLLAGMDMNIDIIGNAPEALTFLPGDYLHALPPFQVSANLVNQETTWGVRSLKVIAGDSDLTGEILVTGRDGQPPFIQADLSSENLVVTRLLPATEEPELQTTEQGGQAESAEGEDVLPESDLFHQRLKMADAQIKFTALELDAAGIALKDVNMELKLNDGALALEPIEGTVGSGAVSLSAFVDASGEQSKGSIDLEVTRVGLGELLDSQEVQSNTAGLLGGEGTFRFTGASVAEILASLDGEMELVMTDGQLDALIVAAGGFDLGELLELLFGDEETADINCAYTRLAADSGLLAIKPLLIITGERNIVGDGHVDFDEETFTFEVEAKAQDFSLLSASNPVRVEGSFSDPDLNILSDELVARGVLAAAGGAVFPPAAILGLVETGDDESEGGCRKAVAAADSARDRAEPE